MLNSQTPLFGRGRKGRKAIDPLFPLLGNGHHRFFIGLLFSLSSLSFFACVEWRGSLASPPPFLPPLYGFIFHFQFLSLLPHIAWKSRSKRKRGKEGGGVGAAILSSRSHVAAPLPSPLPCAFSGKEKGEGGKTFFRSILHPYLSPLPPSAGKPKGEKKPFSFPDFFSLEGMKTAVSYDRNFAFLPYRERWRRFAIVQKYLGNSVHLHPRESSFLKSVSTEMPSPRYPHRQQKSSSSLYTVARPRVCGDSSSNTISLFP